MYDGVSRSDTLQRATGDLRVAVKRRGEASVLSGLRQAGCLKARFPRPLVVGWCDATMVNTSGGVAGGDRLDVAIEAEAGARVTVAAQAAERFYRALPGSRSMVRNTISVATGAAVEWLAQETILFDGSALDRRLVVEVAPDGWFLGCETLVFGRAAMGERVTALTLCDRFEVRRGGVPLLHDAIRLDGDASSVLAAPSVANGGSVAVTMVLVAPDAEARLDAVRAASGAAASAWNGMLVARIVADDSATARRELLAALFVARDGRPMPRAWQC